MSRAFSGLHLAMLESWGFSETSMKNYLHHSSIQSLISLTFLSSDCILKLFIFVLVWIFWSAGDRLDIEWCHFISQDHWFLLSLWAPVVHPNTTTPSMTFLFPGWKANPPGSHRYMNNLQFFSIGPFMWAAECTTNIKQISWITIRHYFNEIHSLNQIPPF